MVSNKLYISDVIIFSILATTLSWLKKLLQTSICPIASHVGVVLYLVTTKWLVFLYITYHIKVNEPCVSSFVCITPKFNQEVNAFSQVLTELLLISAYRLELQIDLYTFPSRISCTNWTKDQSISPRLMILVILVNFLPSL